MSFFDLFKSKPKSCKDCEYYSEYKTSTQLLPDKTVVQGELICISCTRMDARLNDTEACSLFKERTSFKSSTHAYLTLAGRRGRVVERKI